MFRTSGTITFSGPCSTAKKKYERNYHKNDEQDDSKPDKGAFCAAVQLEKSK